jgi:basic amino acid/polyamine antiporter, APA family
MDLRRETVSKKRVDVSSEKVAQNISIGSAIALVIANMIGTGVFTTLGFQLAGIKNTLAVLLLWVIGALASLCGAMVYGELGAAMPRSGGEYEYLSKTYHPSMGFLAGWVSVFVGFPAPIALASMAFGAYFSGIFPVASPQTLAVAVLVSLTLIQCIGVRVGTSFQNVFSSCNIILILFFVIAGLFFSQKSFSVPLSFDRGFFTDIASPAFAVSLVYVSYAFSGWNASAYIAGEIDQPQKNLPLSLLLGTALVAVLYLLINYTFLATAEVSQLAGQIDVGYISADNIFGHRGRDIVGLIISVLLVSSISSFIFVGPRIAQVIGEDYPLLQRFSLRTKRGVPLAATLFQSFISLVLIITTSFETVLIYVGFALNLCTFLAVFGVFVSRWRFPDLPRPYKTWGYPVVPVIFLVIMGWNLVYLLVERPVASSAGLLTMLLGLVFYFAGRRVKLCNNAERECT